MRPRQDSNPEGTGDNSLRDLGLTLMHPFFGEEKRLFKMLEIWADWSDDVKDNVQLLLIDDHGTPSIEEMLSGITLYDYNISVYRVQDDLEFNIPGALNLGMMLAATPWILTMDSDCAFEADVMQDLLDFKPYHKEFYGFFRKRITSASFKDGRGQDEMFAKVNTRVLPCTILLHKDAFININGFDEDFTGTWSKEFKKHVAGYSDKKTDPDDNFPGFGIFDNAFLHRLYGAGYKYVHQRGYIATEWMPDVVGKTATYTDTNRTLNKRIWRAKQKGDIPWSTDMLKFKWTRVIHNLRGNK